MENMRREKWQLTFKPATNKIPPIFPDFDQKMIKITQLSMSGIDFECITSG